jgi:hypothetical protein
MSNELTYAQMLTKSADTSAAGGDDTWNEDNKVPNAWDDDEDTTSTSKTDAVGGASTTMTAAATTTTTATSTTVIDAAATANQATQKKQRQPLPSQQQAYENRNNSSEDKYSSERFFSWNEFEHRRSLRLKDICTFTHAYDGIFLVESDFGKYEWSQKDNAMVPFNGTFLQWCYFRKVYDNFECIGKRTIRDMCNLSEGPAVSIPKPPMARRPRRRNNNNRYGDRDRNDRYGRYNNNNNNNNNNNSGGGRDYHQNRYRGRGDRDREHRDDRSGGGRYGGRPQQRQITVNDFFPPLGK